MHRSASPSPYRTTSPYPQDIQDYTRRDHPPPSRSPVPATHPGSITYTTSTTPQGTLYHPFKAVTASYSTPGGVVNGIQWIPMDATYTLQPGAQPATMEFAASWSRGHLGRNDEKASNDSWGRDEDRRRTKVPDADLRRAREKDAEARKGFGAASSAAGGSTGYPGPGYPPSPYSGHSDRPSVPGYAASSGSGHGYSHERKYSSGVPDFERQLGDLDLRDRDRAYAVERERKNSGPARPRKYSSSEAGGDRVRTVSGNLGSRPDAYANSSYGTSGAYRTSSGRPYSAAGYQQNASPNARVSPNLRPNDAPYPAYPTSNYSTSPNRGPGDILPRSTTPFGGPPSNPDVYPPDHIMAGRPIPRGDRSRAASPMPGSRGAYASGGVAFPQSNASPNMPASVSFPGDGPPPQLAAPEGFLRPVNGSHPFSPFKITRIQHMDNLWTSLPRMPNVLTTHDVYDADWIRLMQDITLAWAGKLPVPTGQSLKRSVLVADLVDLWNTSFFLIRGAELILYRGRERRSGEHAGMVDRDVPYDEPGDYLTSSEEEIEESEDSDLDYAGTYNNIYSQPQQQLQAVFEAGRARKETRKRVRDEKRRQRQERHRIRRNRRRERKYALYLAYVPTNVGRGNGYTSSGGHAGSGYGGSAGRY